MDFVENTNNLISGNTTNSESDKNIEEVLNDFICNEITNAIESDSPIDIDIDEAMKTVENNYSVDLVVDKISNAPEKESVEAETLTCLKEFDTILDDVRNKKPINSSNLNYDIVINVDCERLCDLETSTDNMEKSNLNSTVATWQNIYESFITHTNELKSDNNEIDELSLVINQIGPEPYVRSTNNYVEGNLIDNSNRPEIEEILKPHNVISNDGIKNYDHSQEFMSNFIIPNEATCTTISSTKHINNKTNINGINRLNKNSSKLLKSIIHYDIIVLSSDDEDIVECSINRNAETIKAETKKNLEIDSDDASYHSSDFEFIDEMEATSGPNFNLFIDANNNIETVNTTELSNEDDIVNDYFNTLNAGTNLNEQVYNEEHRIPAVEDIPSLFGGNYTAYPIYTFENKATRRVTGMDIAYEGVGFDMRLCKDDSTAEQRREAQETEEKILSMYSVENQGPRRRRY